MEYKVKYKDELYHHGILGQKWGKRNGPPYPLDAEDHSASEKKAGYKKSLRKFELSDAQKKNLLKIGAAVAIAGISAYGVYKVSQLRVRPEIVKNFDYETFDPETFRPEGFDSKISGNSGLPMRKKIGKSINEIDTRMVQRINEENWSNSGGAINCSHTSVAYILNSLFGKDVRALPFSGIDEFSGAKLDGRDIRVFEAIFDGTERKLVDSEHRTWAKVNELINPGSTGIMRVTNSRGIGHFVNYEKTKDGGLSFIDCQSGIVLDTKDPVLGFLNYIPDEIVDCSNASLREGSDEILKNMIK